MFIELTDHLCCPADHAEQFLVLLPDQMEGRRVVTGDLGCPVCGRVVRIVDGIADFGDAHPPSGRTALTAEAIAAFVGLSGPGGYLVLAGNAAALAPELVPLVPGVRLVLINPAPGTPDSDTGSVIRAARLPIKTGSMRGVVLGSDLGSDPEWVARAVQIALPGLRIVGESGKPPAGGVEVLAEMEGCWVAKKLG